MSYYWDKQRAFAQLHSILDAAKSNKTVVNIPELLYEFSKSYPVSDKAIEKQIRRYADLVGAKIKGDDLVFR